MPSTTRKDHRFHVAYNADTDEFHVEVSGAVIMHDDTVNRTITTGETTQLAFNELDPPAQALGLQFIAAMQSHRDAKAPLVVPPEAP